MRSSQREHSLSQREWLMLIVEDSYLSTICLVSDIRARLRWAVGISISIITCSLLHEQTQLNRRKGEMKIMQKIIKGKPY